MDQTDAAAQAAAITSMDASDILPVERHLLQLLKNADKTRSDANIRTMFRAINDQRSMMVFFALRYAQPIQRKLNLVIKARHVLLIVAALSSLAAIFDIAGIAWYVPVGVTFGWYLLNGPQMMLNIRLGAILLYMGILRSDGEILTFPAGDS